MDEKYVKRKTEANWKEIPTDNRQFQYQDKQQHNSIIHS